MIRKFSRAAALPLACLILAGCGTKTEPSGGGDLHISELEIQDVSDMKNTDLSQRYPEYFRYCFGEDASFKLLRREEDNGYGGLDVYELTYRDKTGTLCTSEHEIVPYSPEAFDHYQSADQYYRGHMQACAESEFRRIHNTGFCQDILVKYLGGSWEDWYNDEEYTILCPSECFLIGFPYNYPDNPELKEAIQRIAETDIVPGTGWQVCTADWQSVASNEEWLFDFDLIIPYDADADSYTEKMKQIQNDYLNCSDQPKSLHFRLKQLKEGDSKPFQNTTVWESVYVLGEEIAPDTDEWRHPEEAVQKRLTEKYK